MNPATKKVSKNLANQRTQQVFTAGNYLDYTYDQMGQLVSAKGEEAGGTTNQLRFFRQV